VFMQPYTGLRTWNGDSVQMGLAREINIKDRSNNFEALTKEAYSEIDYALTEKGVEIYRTVSFNEKTHKIGLVQAAEGIVCKIAKNPAGQGVRIIYQIAVPWAQMNMTAERGRFYWTASINDRDNPKQFISALEIFPLKDQAPNLFGTVTLAK